jgi:DNA-binding transcriptional MerR regulator
MAVKTNDVVTAKDISKKYKVGYPTVNYYTDIGLFPIVGREGNRRLYSDRQIKSRISIISKMVNDGYPLRLIRKKLTDKNGGR